MSVNISRSSNNYYKLRFRVNKPLLPYFKKNYITKSLRTKNKSLAQFKADKLYLSYQRVLHTITVLTSEQIQELVNKFIQEELQQDLIETFTIDSTKYKLISDTDTILQAYEKFATWYKQQNVSDKQYQLTTNKLLNIVIPFFGKDSYMNEITLESILKFRDFLSDFPNTNKLRYKHLTYSEIIQLNDTPQEDIIGISTQIKYIKILKQFFNYASKANIIKHNPCSLVKMPNKLILNREPFNKKEIQLLFNLFETLDNRKFIYYTLVYTGMRPSEFWKATINTSEKGIIYFDLTNRNLKLKTSSSYRVIPLHKELLKMGINKKLPLLQLEFRQAILSKEFNNTIKPCI